jgi:glycosyltransferase involved in cell wall biosynthesis
VNRRVLQLLSYSAGGIARHVAHLTAALDGTDGLAVDVACPPGLPVTMPKAPIELVVPTGLGGHPAAIRRLRKVIDERGYDVVHAHGLRAGVDAALAARGKCPVLVTVHNLVSSDIAGTRARVDRLAEPLVVRLADRTLCVSQQIATHLRKSAPRSAHKVEVLYLGVGEPPAVRRSREEVRELIGVAEGRCLAVAVARLAPQKALPVMFEALERTSSRPVLALLGEGPLEAELRDLCARMGLQQDVRFLGFRDDVADIVAAADVFCLSSVWEGVPLAVQEAMLLRTPVVSTDVGGMREIVSDRRSGRLVASGDPVALAAAIDEVCGSTELGERYAVQARSDLLERFSTDNMLRRLRLLYSGGSDAA